MNVYKYYYSYSKLEGRKDCDKIIKSSILSTEEKEEFIKNMNALEDIRFLKVTRTKKLN